eukprot:5588813-Pyramimonas_sp.AAC.1
MQGGKESTNPCVSAAFQHIWIGGVPHVRHPFHVVQSNEGRKSKCCERKCPRPPASTYAVTEYVVTDTVIVVNPLTGGAHPNVKRCRSSILNP